ncbi:hypothetical protein TVAG_225040 [Trichomonas vaginalis G3]|uniref:DUF3447 domain-containing protein n=1 Tax=Trichomonas vaginalis (strain ATCC PRA-98 / G3) TaxID=412133 RepID=A2FML4_TRIV3|nr:hypothetical protein TVAG_225040 [Trichomonas vaginalis G3]|eukprot:XP_001306782.1 hypothetical protein [Trichomonas vaginalis G3]
MHECLKEEEPDEVCMEFAIISHNVDFISYLYNEYYIDIDLIQCGFYQNLEAFLIYLDLTNDIERCFAHSPEYFDPKLYYYLFEQGALINFIDKYSDTALHYAAHHNIGCPKVRLAQRSI